MEGAGGGTTRYESLLSQVAVLQKDVALHAASTNALREENEGLKKALTSCRSELIKTKQKLASTRQDLIEATESRWEMERINEEAISKWKVQLEARTHELEELQAKLSPQDMDILRIQVQEELEGPHQARVQALEAELEQAHQMFYTCRRELETFRTEAQLVAADQAKELETVMAERRAEVDALKNYARALQEKLEDKEDLETIRKLTREVQALKAALERAQADANDLQAAKDRCEAEISRITLTRNKELAEALARVTSLEADRASFERRLQIAEAEAAKANQEARNAHEGVQAARNEVERLLEAEATKERLLSDMRAGLTADAEKQRARFAAEREDMEHALSLARDKVAQVEARMKQVSEAAAERERRAIAAEEAARRDARTQVTSLQNRIEVLEEELHSQQERGRKAQADYNMMLQRSQRDAEAAKAEVVRISRKKDVLHSKLVQIQQKVEAVQAGIEKERCRADTEAAHRHIAEENSRSARDSLIAAEQVAANLKAELDMVREELEAFKATHARELHVLKEQGQKQAKEAVLTVRDRAAAALKKEKKKAQAYKDKCLEAHSKLNEAKAALTAATITESTGQMETHRARQQIRDLERERDMFLLGGGSLSPPRSEQRRTTD